MSRIILVNLFVTGLYINRGNKLNRRHKMLELLFLNLFVWSASTDYMSKEAFFVARIMGLVQPLWYFWYMLDDLIPSYLDKDKRMVTNFSLDFVGTLKATISCLGIPFDITLCVFVYTPLVLLYGLCMGSFKVFNYSEDTSIKTKMRMFTKLLKSVPRILVLPLELFIIRVYKRV